MAVATSGHTALAPGATVGILGGGQLGRMLSLAAARLGLKTCIYAPEKTGPAAQVSDDHICGAWDDMAALSTFADCCDAITYEWENVPLTAAQAIVASPTPLRPAIKALRTAQDRLTEKDTLSALPGVEVAPYRAVGNSVHDLRRAVQFIGLPCVLKTRRGGYDGKGQRVLKTEADIDPAWKALGGSELILEGFVNFTREVSVIATRGLDGTIKAYPLTENEHRDAILHSSTAPAPNDDGSAGKIARTILDALDYVGTIGVEFFDTPSGLLVNEFAPRVHNSGHWTQDAGCVCQFENHIRAVAGWPLGRTEPHLAVRMTNLIGEDAIYWKTLAGQDTHLHLYGKAEARAGRKMGHVNEVLGAIK
jgi:5-(carboxyamino)imidazole ribonucleotide synthase